MSDEIQNLSSELMLNVVQKEFEYEAERNRGIQNRAGIFISFIGVIMTLFPSYINIKSILNMPNKIIGQTSILLLYLFLIVIVFICLITSLVLFIMTLNTNQYRRLKTSGFIEDNTKFSNCEVALELIKDYKIALEHNIKINDDKVKLFQRAYILLTVSIILIPLIITIKAFI